MIIIRSDPAAGSASAGEFQASLMAIQLRVARRADELARSGMAPGVLKLSCWLQAEQEILDGGLLAAVERRGQSRPSGGISPEQGKERAGAGT